MCCSGSCRNRSCPRRGLASLDVSEPQTCRSRRDSRYEDCGPAIAFSNAHSEAWTKAQLASADHVAGTLFRPANRLVITINAPPTTAAITGAHQSPVGISGDIAPLYGMNFGK